MKSFIENFLAIRDKAFLQAKWNYFETFTVFVVLCGSLSSLFFFISDCQLSGGFALKTILPRMYILLPLTLYLVLVRKVKDYKILSIASLMMCHAIMWCTIGAIIYLPDRSYASDGFVILNLVFFGVSFGTPYIMSSILHLGMIFNIFIANSFLHFEDISLMYSLNIPSIIGIIAASFALDIAYLDNYKKTKKLEKALMTDPLTSCFNRHKLESMLKGNTLNDVGDNLSLLLLDVDFFKKVNDEYGHEAGDVVLQYVASCILNISRKTDIAIRWGGEEFLIILQNCDVEDAVNIAERLRRKIKDEDSGICSVTASIGVLQYLKDMDFTEALTQVDKALYKAKRTGRNKVVKYTAEEFIDDTI